MAESVVKLRVDSKEYDAKIKRAAEGVRVFGENCRKSGESVTKAAPATLEYVRAIGQMETVSKNAKGKINEMTSAFKDLSLQYKHLTDQEKQSVFGQALAHSLDQLKGRIIDSKKELVALDKELEITTTKSKGFGEVFSGIAGKFGVSTSMFTTAGAAVAGVGLAMKLVSDNVATAMNFETSISQLSSLTGKTGEELEQLKEYAIELGGSTTLSASQVADAFKMIGSQQPQLLKSGEALRDVTKAAITLSEAAGIELATAAQTLSTSINQFGGDSDNAARFVNVLAAASQKGAGDIAFLGEAVSKSGVLANAVGASYEELVANLEMLAKAGIDASTSGTALRSIIANLEKQSNDEYKPSVVGLTEAFHNLNEAHLTTVDYVGLAGKQFFSQAMVLAENSDEAKRLTEEITGTNTAEEQAATNTNNLDGSLKSLSSAWEALNLHINSSNGLLRSCVDFLKDVIVWADKAVQSFNNFLNQYNQLQNEDPTDRFVRLAEQAWGNAENSATTSATAPATIPPPAPSPTGGGGGGGGKTKTKKTKKTGRTGRTGGSHKTTPAEKAQQLVDNALSNYAQTISEADLRMEAGLDDTLAHQKKELQAQQRLYEAYGKAYAIHSDPKYKTAYTEAAEKYKSLAKTVKDTETETKKAKEWLKEAEKMTTGVMKTGYASSPEGSILEKLSGERIAADTAAMTNLMEVVIKNGLQGVNISPSDIQQILHEGGDVSDKSWEELVKSINEKLKEKGLKEIQLDVSTGAVTGGGKKGPHGWEGGDKAAAYLGQLSGGLSSISNGIEQLGIDVPSGIEKMITTMQAVQSILTGISSIVLLISTLTAVKSTPIIGTFLARGGVAHAAGGLLTGHHYSGDNVPVLVNSGELILNRAQQGNIASQLTNSGIDNIQLEAVIEGEDIRLAVRNANRRRGRGEYVTTKTR